MQTWTSLKAPCMLLVTELAKINVISDTCSEDWVVLSLFLLTKGRFKHVNLWCMS